MVNEPYTNMQVCVVNGQCVCKCAWSMYKERDAYTNRMCVQVCMVNEPYTLRFAVECPGAPKSKLLSNPGAKLVA